MLSPIDMIHSPVGPGLDEEHAKNSSWFFCFFHSGG
jgi:hypothetical protein